jgi:hypothetical protein
MPFNSETGARAGRRGTAFKQDYVAQAYELAQHGATDSEIADVFGVTVRTIYSWKLAHPDFGTAMALGKRPADERVARSLYQRAVGFHYTEQRAFRIRIGPNEERIELVAVERYMPPQTSACLLWLKMRCPEEWREGAEFDPDDGECTIRRTAVTLDQAQIRKLNDAC